MDKAIIFGIYDFVGFHMGRTLLNKGLEVIGVHDEESSETSFYEEKRMEVGRNANFREISLTELEAFREDSPTKTTFILSLYDLYMLNKETVFQEQMMSRLQQYIESNHNLTDILFLLPIQILKSEEAQPLRTVINQATGWGKNNHFYYLPAIYGPWQPATFTFQQALAKIDDIEIKTNKREWLGDILFVDDAVEAILGSNETSDTKDNRHILIESGKENYWVQCALQLQIDKAITEGIYSEQLEIDEMIHRVSVKRVTPFSESIEKQLEIVKRSS